ncbi:MAG: hypothetical protein KAT68_19145 [Bacteroidales bacterium]|nr:hypothetical protein [Bacteroidales bacterium]
MLLKSFILEQAVNNIQPKLKSKLNSDCNWEALTEPSLMRELTLCLLSSNVKYEIASLYVEKIQKSNLFYNWLINLPKETEIFEILNSSVFFNEKAIRYRFPKLKSHQLYETLISLYSNGNNLKTLLKNSQNGYYARIALVNRCKGIGNKQASMFIRNIGFSNELAILDTHLIDYLKCLNIISSDISINTNKKYQNVEKLYLTYAIEKQYNLRVLDFAIWSVMKVYKSEFN